RARRLLGRRPGVAIAAACAPGLVPLGAAQLLSNRGETPPAAADGDLRGRMTELPLVPGHSTGYAFDINDAGLIVGYSGGAATHAVAWTREGGVRDLGVTLYTHAATP